jgi:acyl-coenzyme A thioesterase PaaI-like protein
MKKAIDLMTLFKEVLGDEVENYTLPPESFTVMQSKILDFSPEEKTIEITMPILDFTLNPFNTMQGGMITAALDNAIGPLSLLTFPFNVTRRMTTEYRRPLRKEMENIYIEARFIEKKGRRLFFEAQIKDEDKRLYVTALSENWIVDR